MGEQPGVELGVVAVDQDALASRRSLHRATSTTCRRYDSGSTSIRRRARGKDFERRVISLRSHTLSKLLNHQSRITIHESRIRTTASPSPPRRIGRGSGVEAVDDGAAGEIEPVHVGGVSSWRPRTCRRRPGRGPPTTCLPAAPDRSAPRRRRRSRRAMTSPFETSTPPSGRTRRSWVSTPGSAATLKSAAARRRRRRTASRWVPTRCRTACSRRQRGPARRCPAFSVSAMQFDRRGLPGHELQDRLAAPGLTDICSAHVVEHERMRTAVVATPTAPSDSPIALNFSTVLPVMHIASMHHRVTYRLPSRSHAIPSPVPTTLCFRTPRNVPSASHHWTGPCSSETITSPRWNDRIAPARASPAERAGRARREGGVASKA